MKTGMHGNLGTQTIYLIETNESRNLTVWFLLISNKSCLGVLQSMAQSY